MSQLIIVLIVHIPQGRATRHITGEKQTISYCISDTHGSTECMPNSYDRRKGVTLTYCSVWCQIR